MKPYTKKDDPKRCPVCGKSKTDYGKPWAALKHHITAMARTELYEREFNQRKKTDTPHVKYLHTHAYIVETTKMIITIKARRK
jgi:hypothetical protein